MAGYEEIVRELERMLLPKDFNWYDGKSSEELRGILLGLNKLRKYEDEINDQSQVERLYAFLLRTYKGFRHQEPPKGMGPQQINGYLSSILRAFEERYAFVERNPSLKRLYRRFGCEFMFKHRIDVKGNPDFNGPLVIISTHNLITEPGILQALTDKHIFFVGDVYFGTTNWLRLHSLPGINWLLKSLGVLEVDRKKVVPPKIRRLLENTLHIFEKGGIVGIFPLGSTEKDLNKWTHGHGGAALIIQNAERALGIKIPILPVGIKKEEKRIVVNFGERYYLLSGSNRDAEGARMIESTRRLAA